jgi:hypothetical protein
MRSRLLLIFLDSNKVFLENIVSNVVRLIDLASFLSVTSIIFDWIAKRDQTYSILDVKEG